MIQRNTVEAHFSEPLKCGLSAQIQVAFLLTTVHYRPYIIVSEMQILRNLHASHTRMSTPTAQMNY